MPSKKKTVDPMIAARDALTGDTLNLKAIEAARQGLNTTDKKQARAHIVLGNILSVTDSARAVCGLKVEA